MPTEETWLGEQVVNTRWLNPLTADELTTCFNNLTAMVVSKSDPVHVVFDLREAGSIPARAPIIAIQSGFFSAENTGKIAVASMDTLAEILASVAARRMRHPILFFKTYEEARAFVTQDAASPNK